VHKTQRGREKRQEGEEEEGKGIACPTLYSQIFDSSLS
jgi:hypothetical protein